MEQRNQKTLIHMHLFKNAGTTFDGLLKQNFGSNFVDHRKDDEFAKVEGLSDYLTSKKNKFIALSSHNLSRDKIQFAKDNSHEIFAVTFVRHPIERIVSVYRFEKQQICDTPGAIAAKKYNEVEYIKWRLNERPEVISNFHARRLGSIESFRELFGKIQTFDFIGLVDRFDNDMRHFFRHTAGIYDFQNEKVVAKNVLDKSGSTVDRKCIDFARRIGDELYLELLQANELDLMLYEYLKVRDLDLSD